MARQTAAAHNGGAGAGRVPVSLLSASGHQLPVLPSHVADAPGSHTEPGGRFRLHDKSLKTQILVLATNPSRLKPYQGLLVVLMMFDSSDLKNANNTLYEVKKPADDIDRWYVVRDLGTALGETGRIAPKRGDPSLFEHNAFITGVKDGFVEFDYHGFHQELFRRRITPDDVTWACELLAGLTDRQWHDAFRAADYEPAVADRFIRLLQQRIADGKQLEP